MTTYTHNLIKPFGINKGPTLMEEAERLSRELEKQEKNKKKKGAETKPDAKPETSNPQSEILSSSDYWTIKNVNYRNQISDYELMKTLLPVGTQDEHAERRIEAMKNNGFYCGDMPLQYAIFEALYNSSESDDKEEARAFIKKSMREKWLMTLTRPKYTPKGKDKIIHNYKIPNEEYLVEENIVAPDREIIQDDADVLEALVSNSDVEQVRKVLNWINETPVWLWRFNSKPKNIDERVAGFDANSGRANLGCCGYPDWDSSLGVRCAKLIY